MSEPLKVEPIDDEAGEAPSLGYATPGDDLLIPEADALVFANCPPKAIRKYVRKGRRAALYYARAKQRQYGPDALDDRCIACDGDDAGYAVSVAWTVTIQPRTLEFTVSDSGTTQSFTTLHSMCGTCATTWLDRVRVRWRTHRVIAIFAWGLLGVGLLMIALGGWLYRMFRISSPAHLFLIGWLGILIFNRLTVWWIGAATPRSVKRCMPKQVVCNGPADVKLLDELRADVDRQVPLD